MLFRSVDSFNLTSTKTKYNGKELEKLQREGVHVVFVNKKTASAEKDSARASCKSVVPVAVAVPEANTSVNQQTSLVTAAPTTQQTPQAAQARAERNTVTVNSAQDDSLGTAAKHQACLKLAADNSSIVCK